MALDLKTLHLFLNIAKTSNMTHGAHKTCISVAAASARIKALEEELNTELFIRAGRGVALTGAGHRLLKHAQLIMRQVDHLNDDLVEPEAESPEYIRIFASTTVATLILPEALTGYLTEHHWVNIGIQERPSKDIARGIFEGSADLGIVAGSMSTHGLQVMPLGFDKLVIVVPAGHLLDGPSPQKLKNVLALPHIGFRQGSTLQKFVSRQAELLGQSMHWRIHVSNFEALCRMVGAGVGVSVVPEAAALRYGTIMQIKSVPLDEPWAMVKRSMLVKDFSSLPDCTKKLIETLTVRVTGIPLHAGTP